MHTRTRTRTCMYLYSVKYFKGQCRIPAATQNVPPPKKGSPLPRRPRSCPFFLFSHRPAAGKSLNAGLRIYTEENGRKGWQFSLFRIRVFLLRRCIHLHTYLPLLSRKLSILSAPSFFLSFEAVRRQIRVDSRPPPFFFFFFFSFFFSFVLRNEDKQRRAAKGNKAKKCEKKPR